VEAALGGLTTDGATAVGAVARGGEADGYIEVVLAGAARVLAGASADAPVEMRRAAGRNQDYREVAAVCGHVELRGVAAYGFRNLQAVVNKMKRGRAGAHLVEMFACPSGCVNGGGQPRTAPPPPARTSGDDDDAMAGGGAAAAAAVSVTPPPAASELTRTRIAAVSTMLHRRTVADALASAPAAAIRAATHTRDAYAPDLHTRFHRVPDLGVSLTIKW